MSHVIPFKWNTSPPWSRVVASVTRSGETVTMPISVKLRSIETVRPYPVRVVDGKIRVDECRMKDGEPYAVRYRDGIYILTRTDGKLAMYEVR